MILETFDRHLAGDGQIAKLVETLESSPKKGIDRGAIIITVILTLHRLTAKLI
jgi:hypothetical protein